MRRLNGYELSVMPHPRELDVSETSDGYLDGYLALPHNTKYSVKIANRNSNRCNATLIVDGKEQGTWRLNAGASALIERPSTSDGRFTFYKLGTIKSKKAAIEANDYSGLVQVVFIPEKKRRNTWTDEVNDISRDGGGSFSMDRGTKGVRRGRAGGQSVSAGGSGLSGSSSQQFGEALPIELDYESETTLSIRLVCLNSMVNDEPRPLETIKSTSVPVSLIAPKLTKKEFREYCEEILEGISKETILNTLKHLEDTGELDISSLTTLDLKKVQDNIYEGW